MRPSRSKLTFRPHLESSEARILATTGLVAASVGQSYIQLVNPTNESIGFGLSGNGGASFHEFTLRAHSSASYHVNKPADDFLIEVGGGTPTALPSGATKAHEPSYILHPSIAVTPSQPGSPGAGGGLGGSIAASVKFTIANKTGRNLTILLSTNNTQFTSYSIPDTSRAPGAKPTPFNFNPGTTVYYKFVQNARGTQLTSLGAYQVFLSSDGPPYLFPNS